MDREILEVDHEITRQERITESYEQLNREALISRQEYEESRDRLAYLSRKRELALAAQREDELFRKSQIEQLDVSLDRMRSNLAVVKENLESLVVRAPIEGRLTALNAEVGQSKARGERLGQIDVLDSYGLSAEIDEYYIARIRAGLRGTFPLADTTYEVRVEKVYPQVISGHFEVDLHFAGDEPAELRRGQSVRMRLELGDPYETVLLPNGPFHRTSGGRWVFVVAESGGVAHRREVTLGRQNARFLEVLAGLEPGDKVITSPYELFGDAERLVLSD
jgi:HlyD family secretion protein